MKARHLGGFLIVFVLTAHHARSQSFVPTNGSHAWNVNANWNPTTYPDATGAAATIPAADANLTIDLGEPITIGTLTIDKSTTGAGIVTTITGSVANSLTFDGGSTITNANVAGAAGTGATILDAPISFATTLNVAQNDNDTLEFKQPLSGVGGLSVTRGASGSGSVILSAANTYTGAQTTFTGASNDNWLVVQLNNATPFSANTNILLTGSAVLDLSAGDFTRARGAGPGQVSFNGAGRNGWGAIGGDRRVNLGGAGASLTWNNTAGNDFGQLVLGSATSTGTVIFENGIALTNNRQFRSYDGTALIDGKITGALTGGGGIRKQGDGVLSLTNALNSYSNNTAVEGGVLRIDEIGALSPNSRLLLGNGGVLGIGKDLAPTDAAADLAMTLGLAAGQLQMVTVTTGPNASNSGFSAHGGNRSVVLNGGAALTWGTGLFLEQTNVAEGANRQFILSNESSDGTLDFKNAIDLGGTARTVVAKNGMAAVDARLSGVISGTGPSGLIKENPGTLELSNANTYEGSTTIDQGTLLLTNAQSLPGGILTGSTGGNVMYVADNPNNIGVMGLGQGDFTRELGTGTGQVQFLGHGGWAAHGANRVVNLGGASQQVTWGAGSFVPLTVLNSGTSLNEPGTLRFGAVGSDATVDFQNPIDLVGGMRNVSAGAGSALVSGILSGVLSSSVTGGGLNKVNSGTLKLTAANSYDGGTTVSLGRLLVSNTSGSGTGSGPVSVLVNGILGGTGTVSGAVTVNSGGHIAAGESIGTLTVGELFMDIGSVLDAELDTQGGIDVSDLIDVTATDGLTIAGGSVVLTNAGAMTAGTYTLIDYFGTLGGEVENLGTPTGPAGFTYSLSNNLDNTSIDLLVAASVVPVPGDYNGNSVVDGADYVVWRKNKGLTGSPTAAQGNGDGDSDVDEADYTYWRERFGNTTGSGAGGDLGGNSSVPEPTTLVLLLLPLMLMTARLRNR